MRLNGTNIATLSGSTDGLRQRNRALLMSVLRDFGPANHAELTERTKLATGTVSTITGELQADGVLTKKDMRLDGRGRPKTVWQANPDAANIAFVQITAQRVVFTLLNFNGGTRDQIFVEREAATTQAFMAQFRDGLERLAQRSDMTLSQLDWLCITSRALVSAVGTKLEWSPVFGYDTIEFADVIPELVGRISLSHEASVLASQLLTNADPSQDSQAVLMLGNSIGFGVAERGATLAQNSAAPGLAHSTHALGGPVCECGSAGCVEAFAGFYGILRNAMDGPKDRVAARFIPVEQMEKLATQARMGDKPTIQAFRDAGEALGVGISRFFSLSHAMPLMVLGTGAAFFDLMEDSFHRALQTSLQIRLTGAPSISLRTDTDELTLRSGISASLRQLDENVVSIRALHCEETPDSKPHAKLDKTA